MNEEHHHKQPALVKSVLERIEREHVIPVSERIVAMRHGAYWALWILSLLIMALTFAAVIYTELNAGWEWYDMTHDDLLTFFVATLPIIWIVFLILGSIAGYAAIKKTRKGYKYTLVMAVFLTVGIGLAGGSVLHTLGVGSLIDEDLVEFIPFEKPVAAMRQDMWMQPSRGLYHGILIEIDSAHHSVLVGSPDNVIREFNTQYVPSRDLSILKSNTDVAVVSARTQNSPLLYACRLLLLRQPHHMSINELFAEHDRFWNTLVQSVEDSSNTDETMENPCTDIPEYSY